MDLSPAVCDVSVTNVCNATCDFCGYAYNKGLVRDRRWIDRSELAKALPILRRRGVSYLNFQGGEPLLHPEIAGLVADASLAGMTTALVTNGSQLPEKIQHLADAGLHTLLVSIDSHSIQEHERNRSLPGVGKRIAHGLAQARRLGIPSLASVTVNRLVSFEALPDLLERLGFDAVTFSYPRTSPLGSSSLVYGEESRLVNFTPGELVDALESIQSLKKRFPVLNPTASIEDIRRFVRGEPQVFACVGGHKYFYLDWNLQIWRCENWNEPLGSVFDFDRIADMRDRCTACTMSCYRDTSVLMHAGVAIEGALTSAAHGRLAEAARLLVRGSVAISLRSIVEEVGMIRRLSRNRRRGGPRISRPRSESPSTKIHSQAPSRIPTRDLPARNR